MKSSPARIRQHTFVSCGLSEKEALLYDTLLTLGEASGSQLEHATGLKKNSYALVKALLRKSLLIPVRRDRKIRYQPAPPEAILSLLKKQEEGVKETRRQAEAILPSLSSQYQLNVGKPTIRYYEGETGLREVFADIYAPKDDVVYGCVDLEVVDSVFPQHILQDLIPLRIKNKLFAYSYVADSTQARAIRMNDEKQLRKTVLLDKKDYPLPAEIDVYEDKIAMLSFERGKFIGMIIQNQAFAVSLRSIFSVCFQKLSPPKKGSPE